MENKIFINLNENNIIYNKDISVDFVMKTIYTETLNEVMSDYSTTNDEIEKLKNDFYGLWNNFWSFDWI